MKRLLIMTLLLLAIVCPQGVTHSSEPLKITAVHDANLFRTESGQLISLSNVEAFSIFDTDSLKSYIAKDVLNFGEQKLLNQTLFSEFQYSADSVQVVHLFEKVGRTRRSINQLYLKKGFGYFVENPYSQYSDYYRVAAKEAKRDGLGVHGLLPKAPFISNALWLSAGIGIGAFVYHGKYGASTDGGLAIDLAGYFRKNKIVCGAGFFSGVASVNDLAKSAYFTLGKSFYKQYEDIVLSAGISLNEYEKKFEDYFGDDEFRIVSGVQKSQKYWGAHFEINSVGHFSHVLGLGLKLSADWNSKNSYVVLSLCPCLGSWDL